MCPCQALMVVSLVAEQHVVDWLGDLISAQEIVHIANTIFLQDQVLVWNLFIHLSLGLDIKLINSLLFYV